MDGKSFLNLLQDHIDITIVPFCDRGSRLLLFRYFDRNALYLKLSERIIALNPDPEAYLLRPPFIQDLELIDECGMVLDFSVTSSPDRLLCHTLLGDFEIAFQSTQTLAIHPPQNNCCGIRFSVAQAEYCTEKGRGEPIRKLLCDTNAPIITKTISTTKGGYAIELLIRAEMDSAILLHVPIDEVAPPPVLPFSLTRSNAEQRWEAWFEHIPPVNAKYLKTYALAWWVMANNLIAPYGKIRYEAMMPSKVGYVGLWLWDSAIHALAYRYVNPELARDQLRAMLVHQLPDGMLPDAVFDEDVVFEIDHPIQGRVTKPPILAWSAMQIHQADPNLTFLNEIYDPLLRLGSWWCENNDDDRDGMVQYNHPYSSGLDDSPLWDDGMPVESPELNTYLWLHFAAMAEMAALLGKGGDSERWKAKAHAIVSGLIDHFWDEKTGLFLAQKYNEPIRVATPFSLFPLWTGALPERIHSRLVDHLSNPNEFWGKFAVPTVARNDAKFDPQTMWRGPVWANINYFLIAALEISGDQKLADQLCAKTLDMINRQHGIYEYYNAETGIPPKKAMNMFGWTAAIFIDLAIRTSRRK
jgi:glycogen debranching enzyme